MTTIKCPFCAEEISPEARKCKHCGEWLESPSVRVEHVHKGSVEARAVSKGAKEAEYSKTISAFLMLLVIGIAFVVGLFTHWIVGLIIFFVLGSWISSEYYKE